MVWIASQLLHFGSSGRLHKVNFRIYILLTLLSFYLPDISYDLLFWNLPSGVLMDDQDFCFIGGL